MAKPNLLSESKKEVLNLLNEYFEYTSKPTIDNNLEVSFPDYAECQMIKPSRDGKLPVRFDKVYKFTCKKTNLNSFEGFPKQVDHLDCYRNNFTNLEGLRNTSNFVQSITYIRCNLLSLEGFSFTTNELTIMYNPLTSLKGMSGDLIRDFKLALNPNLKSLDGLEKCNVDNLTLGYEPDLPLLPVLSIKGKIDFTTESENLTILKNILNKYIQNRNMSLSEKRIRCKLELLEYPEYIENATW